MERFPQEKIETEIMPNWIRPNLYKERGEIERVATTFFQSEPIVS